MNRNLGPEIETLMIQSGVKKELAWRNVVLTLRFIRRVPGEAEVAYKLGQGQIIFPSLRNKLGSR